MVGRYIIKVNQAFNLMAKQFCKIIAAHILKNTA